VRYLMSRPLQAEEILSAAPRKLQQAAIQPYGLTNVQANLFTTAQRSTTSSVDPTKKFPICIIGGCTLRESGSGHCSCCR